VPYADDQFQGGFGFGDDVLNTTRQNHAKGHASGEVNLEVGSGMVSGNFGFDVDLGSGRISEGTVDLSYSGYYSPYPDINATLSLGGGTGQADAKGDFNIGGFSGALTIGSAYLDPVYAPGGNLSVWGDSLFSGGEFDLYFNYHNPTSLGDIDYITGDPIHGNLTVGGQ
jgi:hypothetical protein